MLKPVLENPWVLAVGVLVALAAVCLLCYLLAPVLIPLFLAFLVAYMLDPVVDFFEARRIPRGAAITGLAVLALLVVLSIPLFVAPGLIGEANELIAAAAKGITAGDDGEEGPLAVWAARFVEWLPLDDLVRHMGWEEENLDAPRIIAKHVGEYVRDNAVEILRTLGPHVAAAGQKSTIGIAQFLSMVGRSTAGFVILLANFALFAFVAGYLLKDFDGLIAAAKDLVPLRYRTKTFDLVGKIDVQLRSFLRGQMLVCFCLGVMYAIGLLIAGTPFAVLIAVFGAVASFVPYLGIILTIGPALLLTLLQHRLDWRLAAVVATFVVAQTIEGTVLTPKIVGDKVGLNPVWVILAILVFGGALGFLGLLLAVPIAATLKVLVVEAIDYYKRSPAYGGGDSET